MTDGWDQSWGYADPATAAQQGMKVVAGYLSHDPSKNWTAAKIKAYHQHGIGVILNWESEAGRPLLGNLAGHEDATAARTQADQLISEVGYAPQSRLAIVFSCDRDVTQANWPQIDTYYGATRSVIGANYINGVYGEADLIDHLHAAGLTQMEWQTLAWSNGRISGEADFYQSSINNTLAGVSVDFDRILHSAQLGAWWPPGHTLNSLTPTILTEDDMPLAAFQYQVGHAIRICDPLLQHSQTFATPADLAAWKAVFRAAGGKVYGPKFSSTQAAAIAKG